MIIGTMNLTRTRDSGQFFCPTCEGTQPYRLRAARPFLTIYFIPVIPIGGQEFHVHCAGCRQKWDTGVLTLDAAEEEALRLEEAIEEILRASVLVVLADDVISEAEIQALLKISNEVLHRPLEREELGQLCSIAQQRGVRVINYVRTISHQWSPDTSRLALQCMFLAASAEGELQPPQMEGLLEIQQILGLNDDQFQGIIEESLLLEESLLRER